MRKEGMVDISMFVLRLVIGMIFLAHGAQKLFGTFDGIGIEGTAKMVEGMGFLEPHIVAVAWAGIEFVGGILLIFGILARWAAISVVLTVLVRAYKLSLMYGFFLQNGGVEYDLLIIGASIPIILIGGGRWSVWDI